MVKAMSKMGNLRRDCQNQTKQSSDFRIYLCALISVQADVKILGCLPNVLDCRTFDKKIIS